MSGSTESPEDLRRALDEAKAQLARTQQELADVRHLRARGKRFGEAWDMAKIQGFQHGAWGGKREDNPYRDAPFAESEAKSSWDEGHGQGVYAAKQLLQAAAPAAIEAAVLRTFLSDIGDLAADRDFQIEELGAEEVLRRISTLVVRALNRPYGSEPEAAVELTLPAVR